MIWFKSLQMVANDAHQIFYGKPICRQSKIIAIIISSSSCHQTSVFHLSTHFFAVSLNLLRSSYEQGRAGRVNCIMCAVFMLPDRTHTWCLLQSTPKSVSVPSYRWILYVVDFDTSTSSMDYHILLLGFRLCWQ